MSLDQQASIDVGGNTVDGGECWEHLLTIAGPPMRTEWSHPRQRCRKCGRTPQDVVDGANAQAKTTKQNETRQQPQANSFRRGNEYVPRPPRQQHRFPFRNAADDSRLGSYQDLAITIKDVPAPPLVFTRLELLEGSAGIITRLENKMAGLPDYEAQLRQTITEKQAVLADVESQAGKPFKYEAKLVTARAKCAELDGKLRASIEPPKQNSADAPVVADVVDPALARFRKLHDASFPTAPNPSRPSPASTQAPSTKHPHHERIGGLER